MVGRQPSSQAHAKKAGGYPSRAGGPLTDGVSVCGACWLAGWLAAAAGVLPDMRGGDLQRLHGQGEVLLPPAATTGSWDGWAGC